MTNFKVGNGGMAYMITGLEEDQGPEEMELRFMTAKLFGRQLSAYLKPRLLMGAAGLAAIGYVALSPVMVVAGPGDDKPFQVVELFTSQGCSSCPPADKVLAGYVKKRPDVMALSYSVDYWDYLGWRDTFGQAAHSDRQRDYAKTRGDGQVYTPQVVVNGLAHVNGAHKALIEREMKKSAKSLHDRQVVLTPKWAGKDIQVGVDAGAVPQGKLTLWVLRVQDEGTVRIKRGENGGRNLSYHNIVLGAERAVELKKGFGEQIRVPKLKKPLLKDQSLVFLLQVGKTGAIIGAGRLRR